MGASNLSRCGLCGLDAGDEYVFKRMLDRPGGEDLEAFDVKDGRAISKIVGTSEDRVLAVTTGGSVYRWDDDEWHDLEGDFDCALYGITSSASGAIYVCGEGGLVARYEDERWEKAETI